MMRSSIGRKALSILAAIIFFFVFTSLVGFFTYLKPSKIVSDITPKDLDLVYENVSFVSDDGVALQGWYIPQQALGKSPLTNTEAQKTIILLHGWPADKGNILPATSFLAQDYNLMLFDFRGLGKSRGSYSTIGVQEPKDLTAAIQYLKSQNITEVGVWGFSMGAAVALMTSPGNSEVQAIVSESSYASLNSLASEAFRIPVVNHALGYLTGFWAKLFLGVDISKASPETSVSALKIPILLIHSKADEAIPFSHALRLKEALSHNPQAEFWFQKDLVHGQFSAEYQARILEFFQKNL